MITLNFEILLDDSNNLHAKCSHDGRRMWEECFYTVEKLGDGVMSETKTAMLRNSDMVKSKAAKESRGEGSRG